MYIFMRKSSHKWLTTIDVAESWTQVRGFRVMKNKNKSIKLPKLHFRVTKKDLHLVFHFHIYTCFGDGQSGFDQTFKWAQIIQKNPKNVKPAHIVVLCDIVTI